MDGILLSTLTSGVTGPEMNRDNYVQYVASVSETNRDATIEAAEYAAKYRTYERDYLRRINHKYFSGKNLAGAGRVFDTVTTVDGFVVKESREAPITRFLETPNSQEEQLSKSAIAPAAKRHMTRKST